LDTNSGRIGPKAWNPLLVNDDDLAKFDGKRVRVTFKDGRKMIGVLQRDLTDRCWELLRADADKPKNSPPGVGDILFLQDVKVVEEFKLH
jgi:hypothetical protein